MARPRSEAARVKMLAAAAAVVLEVGVRGFTIDAVARRSGVAKTTIYRHFPNRNELLIAALDEATPVPSTPDNDSLRADLLEYLANVLPIFADPALRATSLDIMAAAALDPELRQMHRAMVRRRAGPLMTIYTRARERGEIALDLDYATAFEIIEGSFIVRSLVRPEALHDIDLESLVDRIVGMLGP